MMKRTPALVGTACLLVLVHGVIAAAKPSSCKTERAKERGIETEILCIHYSEKLNSGPL
jgi:hypothetical protein